MQQRQLNIAMIGHKRVPSREGGVEVVVTELAQRMTALGHHVTCYNRHSSRNDAGRTGRRKVSDYNGVRLVEVPTLDHQGLAAVTSSVSATFMSLGKKYDVIHYHAEGPALMCWLPKLLGRRVIVTVHGLDHQRAKWGWFARHYLEWGEKAAVRWADEIIVLSRNLQQYFRETYGRETAFVPNGVSRPISRKASYITEQYGLQKDGYILFLARIVPEKGLKYLIEAFQKVITDRKLVIAGRYPDGDPYGESMAELALSDDRILFTGFAQGECLEELFSNAYVYVLPSDLEGMPISLLEAMSYGNCCLVSSIPECTEVITEMPSEEAEDCSNSAVLPSGATAAGMPFDGASDHSAVLHAEVFRKSDTQDLAQKLQYLCDHPDTVEAYRADAADYVCSRYNWDEVTKQTLDLYMK